MCFIVTIEPYCTNYCVFHSIHKQTELSKTPPLRNREDRGHAADLAMSPDDGAEQFPRPTSTIDANHSENLEEPKTAQCRRGEHLSTGTEAQNDDAGRYDNDI